MLGIEPRISSLGGKRLIHWATRVYDILVLILNIKKDKVFNYLKLIKEGKLIVKYQLIRMLRFIQENS